MKKVFIALLVLFLTYAATGWFLAPLLVDKALRQYAANQYGLELTFDKLTLYPFSFSTQLDNLVILDPDNKPLFTATKVEAKSGFLGFWTQSGAFSNLAFFGPRISLGQDEPDRRGILGMAVALAESFQDTERPVRIATLRLLDAEFVTTGDSGSSARVSWIPAFDFESTGFGESVMGDFQLILKPAGQSETRLSGDLGWDGNGARGALRFVQAAPDMPFSAPEKPFGHRWKNLTVEAPFVVSTGTDAFTANITSASLGAELLQFNLQRLVEVSAGQLTAEFNATVRLTPDGLLIGDLTASGGPLTVLGLTSETLSRIEVPVRRAGLELPEFAIRSENSIPFRLRLQVEPEGEISLDGRYGVVSGDDVVMIDWRAVPVASMLNVASGALPSSLSAERFSGKGRLEMLRPAKAAHFDASAAITLSGGFESGGTVNLEGMTQLAPPDNPLPGDWRLEWDVGSVDARLLSPWAERFGGRRMMSGKLGSRLELRSENGQLAGHYAISLDNPTFQVVDQPGDGSLSDPEFTVALLQDADQRIRLSIPLEENRRRNDLNFSGWLQAEVEAFLSDREERPMDTLAWVVGMESDRLDNIVFEPGQAGLSSDAVALLEWLKTALQWRPGLALRVSAAYDPIADRNALAGQQIRLHVNLATAVNATEREKSAPIDFTDAKARAVLDEFAGSRLGNERVEAIASSFHMDESVAGPAQAEDEKVRYYRSLFDALVENEEISERALLSLARFRARTVIDQLAREGIERSRLESGNQYAVDSSAAGGVPVDLELLLMTPETARSDETVILPLVSEPKFTHIEPITSTRRIK